MNNSLGYVLMLDVSDSMYDAIEQLKINTHAFVGWSRVGDQFGINTFSDDAQWLYPTGSNPNILTVSPDYKEVSDSYDYVENLKTRSMTNIGDAIKLGNDMISKATTDLKAFVLLSDGYHNTGTHPKYILGNTPPLYVAGLGSCLRESYFKEMLEKNPKSKFYNKPNAYEMTLMFDEILADSTDSALVMHKFDTMRRGAYYQVEKFDVSRDENEIFIHSVWAGKKYKYTSKDIQKNTFKITLMDPNDKATSYQPDIVEDGYCVYRLKDLRPGQWKVLTEYSIDEANYATLGGMDFATSIHTTVDAPTIAKLGEPIKFVTNILDGNSIIENAKVTAHIERPTISVENALKKYDDELRKVKLEEHMQDMVVDEDLAKLEIIREQKLSKVDILARTESFASLDMSKEGTYDLTLDNVNEPGIYEVNINIEGIDPQTGYKFSDMKNHTIIVE